MREDLARELTKLAIRAHAAHKQDAVENDQTLVDSEEEEEEGGVEEEEVVAGPSNRRSKGKAKAGTKGKGKA